MFRRSVWVLIIIGALLSMPAPGQQDNWAAVMRLPPQTMVTVWLSPPKPHKRARPRLCRILQAGTDGITCGVIVRDREWMEQFARPRVQQIRLEHVVGTNRLRRVLIGAAIGGGLCAAVFATGAERHPVAAGALGFLYCGAIGTFIGAHNRTEGYKLEHGSVVYRSSNQ